MWSAQVYADDSLYSLDGVGGLDTTYDFGASWLSDKDIESIIWDSVTILSVIAVDQRFEDDKTLHYVAGVAVARLASAYCDSRDFNFRIDRETLNYLCGLGAATLAGVLKEVYDSTGRGNVDVKDALATSEGGAFVGLRSVF